MGRIPLTQRQHPELSGHRSAAAIQSAAVTRRKSGQPAAVPLQVRDIYNLNLSVYLVALICGARHSLRVKLLLRKWVIVLSIADPEQWPAVCVFNSTRGAGGGGAGARRVAPGSLDEPGNEFADFQVVFCYY